MPTEHRIDELLPAYALGTLDNEELEQVVAHLADCSSCREELVGYEALVTELGMALPQVDPPPQLKERLLRSMVEDKVKETAVSHEHIELVAPSKITPIQRLRNWFHPFQNSRVLRPALVIVVILLIFSNLFLVNQLQAPSTRKGMVSLPLTATDDDSPASGFFLASADGLSGAIIADDLPQLDEDHAYQFWLIVGDETVSGALFTVDELGYGGKWIGVPKSLFQYTHFAITVEPAAGSEQPTGEVVLSGEFEQ